MNSPMQNAIATAAVMGVLLLAAAFAYDRWVIEPRMSSLQREIATINRQLTAQLESKNAEIAELKGEVSNAADRLKSAVQESEKAYDNLTDRQARQQRLGQALARLSPLKTIIAEAFQTMGSLPTDLTRETGIASLAEFQGSGVSSLSYQGGTLRMIFDASIAEGAVLSLKPEASESGMIDWRCQVKGLPESMLKGFTDCRAVP